MKDNHCYRDYPPPNKLSQILGKYEQYRVERRTRAHFHSCKKGHDGYIVFLSDHNMAGYLTRAGALWETAPCTYEFAREDPVTWLYVVFCTYISLIIGSLSLPSISFSSSAIASISSFLIRIERYSQLYDNYIRKRSCQQL